MENPGHLIIEHGNRKLIILSAGTKAIIEVTARHDASLAPSSMRLKRLLQTVGPVDRLLFA